MMPIRPISLALTIVAFGMLSNSSHAQTTIDILYSPQAPTAVNSNTNYTFKVTIDAGVANANTQVTVTVKMVIGTATSSKDYAISLDGNGKFSGNLNPQFKSPTFTQTGLTAVTTATVDINGSPTTSADLKASATP